jgi:hypothetical protein
VDLVEGGLADLLLAIQARALRGSTMSAVAGPTPVLSNAAGGLPVA